jgi:hypothetical protein
LYSSGSSSSLYPHDEAVFTFMPFLAPHIVIAWELGLWILPFLVMLKRIVLYNIQLMMNKSTFKAKHPIT